MAAEPEQPTASAAPPPAPAAAEKSDDTKAPPTTKPAPEAVPTAEPVPESKPHKPEQPATTVAAERKLAITPPVTSNATHHSPTEYNNETVNPPDFEGAVETNNDLPSAETIKRLENYVLLDRDGKTHTFKSLYTGKHVARRVLVIFVRHFYCGNCQEYLRALSTSITPDALLRLPISTFIAVVGCGDPGLIDMYAQATGCPFPIYADPTRKIYDELGMIKTLALGARPAYITDGLLKSSVASIFQGLKQIKAGLATKGGDARQIGGEFLFEPFDIQSPVGTPWAEIERKMGHRTSDTSLDGKQTGHEFEGAEEKRVTWCHRMRTTRDHAEIPEIMEVLGLDGQGMPIKDEKRWKKAVESRKGTGLSMAGQMKAEAAGRLSLSTSA